MFGGGLFLMPAASDRCSQPYSCPLGAAKWLGGMPVKKKHAVRYAITIGFCVADLGQQSNKWRFLKIWWRLFSKKWRLFSEKWQATIVWAVILSRKWN
jgi:hypothetical protein